jgi:hypothetical protein
MAKKQKSEPTPVIPCFRTKAGMHFMPKMQKDSEGNWHMKNPELLKLSAPKNTKESGRT